MLENSSSPISIDRPDIAKKEGKAVLSYKEGKDVLYKFLLLSGFTFCDSERLYVKTQHKLNLKKDEPLPDLGPIKIIKKKGKLTKKQQKYNELVDMQVPFLNTHLKAENTEYFYEITNPTFYTVSCKLKDILIDGRPIYIVMLEDSFLNLKDRNKKRLLSVKSQYNIIIFDVKDLKKIGIEISDKKWISPLSKKVLKKWANLLFERMSDLGSVDSSFTLNDVYSYIDASVSSNKTLISSSVKSKEESYKYKAALYEKILSEKAEIRSTHLPVINSLCSLNQTSVKWIESIIESVIKEGNKINLKNKKYKSIFEYKSNNLCNVISLSKVIYKLLNSKSSIFAQELQKGVFRVSHTKTLESFILWISAGSEDKKFILNDSNYEELALCDSEALYFVHFTCSRISNKYYKVTGSVGLSNNHTDSNNYSKIYRLPVYLEKDLVYSLDIPFL